MEQLNTLCMDDSTKTVCVTSYNSGDMGLDKQNYIKSLTLFSDILCIQEHFLLDSGNKKYSNTQKLKKLFEEGWGGWLLSGEKVTQSMLPVLKVITFEFRHLKSVSLRLNCYYSTFILW